MNAIFSLFILLFVIAIIALVRCWYRTDPRYLGWILLALFSLLGSIAAQAADDWGRYGDPRFILPPAPGAVMKEAPRFFPLPLPRSPDLPVLRAALPAPPANNSMREALSAPGDSLIWWRAPSGQIVQIRWSELEAQISAPPPVPPGAPGRRK